MTKSETAVNLFNSGFNCAQSVLASFCEEYGLDQETGLKLASGLGGGFRCGEVCGAVSGAVLVIGLKYGQSLADDSASKSHCNSETVIFMERFRKDNKSCICREILGCDISTQEGRERALRENLFKTTCVDMVESAVGILEEMGY
jgi:C_GCAxxG_C_C family probable redox protein